MKSISSAAYGRLAIASSYRREICILEARSDSKPFNSDPPDRIAYTERKNLWHRNQGSQPQNSTLQNPVSAITFSPDGRKISYTSEHGIHVLDSATQREVRYFRTGYTASITISERYVAYANHPGTVHVWNLASGQLLKILENNLKYVDVIAFSLNNKILLAANSDKRVMNIWDTRTWSLEHTLEVRNRDLDGNLVLVPEKELQSVAFSRDGKRIAFLRWDSLSIWDAEQYCCLQIIKIKFPPSDSTENQISVFVEDSYIDTTFGRVYLDQPPDENGLWKVEEPRWRVWDDWLYHDGQRMLWLPSDFRPSSVARYNDLFVMGHDSGKVTFFEGKNDDTAPEAAYQNTALANGSTTNIKARKFFHRWGKGAG